MRKFTFLFLLLTSCISEHQLSVADEFDININEPSDNCYDALNEVFWMVSDNGFVFNTDLKGNILLKKEIIPKADFEAILKIQETILVVDEKERKIHFLDEKLNLKRTIYLPEDGAENAGYEGLTYIPEAKTFILAVEKNPCKLKFYDENFNFKKEKIMNGISDISALCLRNENLFLLSDEDQSIYKLNSKSFDILEKWHLPVQNPEGITFVENFIYIVSDDLNKLYQFEIPLKP